MSSAAQTALVQELVKLNPTALVELFELNLSALAGNSATPPIRFHNGTNNLSEPISFQGLVYNPLPIRVKGFEMTSDSRPPRISLTLANVAGWLSSLLRDSDDLIGATLTRRRTFARFLDGSPEASPALYPDDVFVVHRKISENRTAVELECLTPLDMDGVLFPRRIVTANYCWFRYRGSGCGYSNAIVVANGRDQELAGGARYAGDWSPDRVYYSGTLGRDSVTYTKDGFAGDPRMPARHHPAQVRASNRRTACGERRSAPRRAFRSQGG